MDCMIYGDEGRRNTNWIKRRHHPNHCVTGLCMQECQRRRRAGVVTYLHHEWMIIVEPQAIPPITEPPTPPSHHPLSHTMKKRKKNRDFEMCSWDPCFRGMRVRGMCARLYITWIVLQTVWLSYYFFLHGRLIFGESSQPLASLLLLL